MGSTFRKGSQQSGQATGLAGQAGGLAGLAGNYGNQLLGTGIPQLTNFLTTGQLPPSLSGALTGGLELNAGNTNAATQSILDTGLRGGALRSQLAQAQLQRMTGIDQLRSQLASNLFNTAVGGGENLLTGGISGLNQSAGTLSQLGQQRINQNQQFKSGLGQVAGGSAKALLA